MADDFDPVSNGRADSPEHGHVGSQDGLREPMPAIRLLIGYGNALDSIAAKRSIVFLPHCSVRPGSPGPCKVLPRVNRMAALLAEAHVAARLDTLLRKGHRSRALDPQEDSQLDLERLQNFRDSLSPAGWKTLALWVILFALAIAFPVAKIADYLRTLVPRIIVCSSTYSFAAMSASLSGSSQQPNCRVHHEASLEKTLLRVAHLNLNAGSFIDTVLSVRASGFIGLLLLTVVMILSVCVVLLVFRSGFRLKRLAFSIPPETPADQREKPDHESLLRSGTGSGGLYELERSVFAAVRLRPPREFPLDLAVAAGLLALPVTIVADLFILAATPRLDVRTRIELFAAATGLIVAIILRLWWLGRVWRSRIGPEGMKPRRERVRNATTVLARSSWYGAVLLATCCAVWDMMFVEEPREPFLQGAIFLFLVSPAVAWSLSWPWWYWLHRDLNVYSRLYGHRTFRAPVLCVVPLLSAAAAAVMFLTTFYLPENAFIKSGPYITTFLALSAVGIFGCPAGIYRMAWKLKRLRCDMPYPRWRANAAGLAATGMYVLPPVAFLHFHRSLNRIWAESTTTVPTQSGSAESHTDVTMSRGSRNS
jgi:hypothetical protein